MTGGQSALALDEAVRVSPVTAAVLVTGPLTIPAAALRVVTASAEECAAHDEMMKVISKASGGKALWQ
jgi:hypothetical protein